VNLDPADSLRALHALGPLILVDNPCRRAPARWLWSAEGHRGTPASLERRYGWVVAEEGGGERHPSDFYVCSGASTFGSGRSFFVDGVQMKGVGRTKLAPVTKDNLVSDGALLLERAVAEVHRTSVVRALWSVPSVPLAFALLLPRVRGAERDTVLLGRAGSPMRIGHLSFLRGSSYRLPYYARIAAWHRLVNGLHGVRATETTLDRIHALFDAVVANALTGVAESRLFGLAFANWPDNGDLLARPFDCEDLRFRFGRKLYADLRLAPSADESPAVYFTRKVFNDKLDDPYRCSLQFLHNAFLGLEHLGAALTYDESILAARYPWDALERGYRDALARALARVTGASPPRARRAATELCAAVPLVPRARLAAFAPRPLLDALAPRAARARLDTFCAALDQRAIDATTAALKARARTIAAQPAVRRLPAYRALFRDAESAASALAV
jgi:hypothetical protein